MNRLLVGRVLSIPNSHHDERNSGIVMVSLELIGVITARRIGQVKDARRDLLVGSLALFFRFVAHVVLSPRATWLVQAGGAESPGLSHPAAASLLTSPAPPAHGAQKGGSGAEQEPEVVPVPAPRLVVEGELLPPTEDVHDEDDPGRKAVPEAPQQVCPPHDVYLLYNRRSFTSSETTRARTRSKTWDRPLLPCHSRTSSTPDPPSIIWCSGQAGFS
jgi:hypothetical protein